SALPIVCKRSRTPTNRERNRQMTETKGNSTILQGKRAVIFGAGGSVGSAVAREFALEGAEVFLAGRTKSRLDEVAKEISMAGGLASVAVVDALNAQAVDEYIDRVEGFGKIDIEFNAVGPPAADYGSGKPALQLSVDEFMVPLTTIVKSQFITARSVARHMVKRREGVIIFLSGSNARGHAVIPGVLEGGASSIGTAFGGVETFMENLAFEISVNGVRAVCLRTTANVDTKAIQDTLPLMAKELKMTKEEVIKGIGDANFLKSPATTTDTAKLAVLLASDRVRMITGTVVNSTAAAGMD